MAAKYLAGPAALLALAFATNAGAAERPSLDYADMANWVCHPDKPGSCLSDLTATIIEADGSQRSRPLQRAATPAVDCFYVYPTVSEAPGVSAPAGVTEAERRAARQQLEQFASVCRLYAPAYRQITVEVMKRGMRGEAVAGVPEAAKMAARDVEDAWTRYLATDNQGRGVILIGHSQGAGLLADLIRRRIEGAPARARLVSAILPGTWIIAPKGTDVGGDFKSTPACRSADQTGCVITYNAVRAERPIPAEMAPKFEADEPICTNPTALAGGVGVTRPFLSTSAETIIPDFTAPQSPWTTTTAKIDTPFVTLPVLYTAECRSDRHGVYLAIQATRAESDQRTGALAGDIVFDGKTDPTMGLHLIDLNIVGGDLTAIAARQAAAWTAGRR